MWMEILFICVICSIVGGMIGGTKRQLGTGIFSGLFLGPVGVLLMIASPGDFKKCPFCISNMHPEATVCSACTRELPVEKKDDAPAAEKPSEKIKSADLGKVLSE